MEALDFQATVFYDLEPGDVQNIADQFNLVNEHPGQLARLRPRRWLDELPYEIHTNRELAMMLAEKKPLATFSEYYPSDHLQQTIPESFFDPYVAAGLFEKREEITPGEDCHRIRRVLYAAKAEAWRIDAYLDLMRAAKATGWNQACERREGLLLGYEEWQNTIYIETLNKHLGKAQPL